METNLSISHSEIERESTNERRRVARSQAIPKDASIGRRDLLLRYDHRMPTAKGRQSDPGSAVETVRACPVEQAIHVIGGKWKLLLLRSLLLHGPQRYNELLAGVDGISSKELTRNLRELVVSGLITRGTDASARTAPYSLTPSGKGLMPTFKSLLTWGQKTWYGK